MYLIDVEWKHTGRRKEIQVEVDSLDVFPFYFGEYRSVGFNVVSNINPSNSINRLVQLEADMGPDVFEFVMRDYERRRIRWIDWGGIDIDELFDSIFDSLGPVALGF